MHYDVAITNPAPNGLLALRAAPAGRARVEASLGWSLGGPGRAAISGKVLSLPVAADEWLLSLPPADTAAAYARLDALFVIGDGAVSVVTDAYAQLRVTGPDVATVMAQIVALDLDAAQFPPGCATRCACGRASAIVHHLPDAAGYDLYVDTTLARYARRLLEVTTAMHPA